MAQLPPDGQLVMQQIDGRVVLYHRDTEAELVRFDPADPASFGPALGFIWNHPELTEEQKCFAAFWAGYFYAHTGGND